MSKKMNALLKAAIRYHYSWDNAVTMAGFKYEIIKKLGRAKAGNQISRIAIKKCTDGHFIKSQQQIIVDELHTLYKDNSMLTYSFLKQNKIGLVHRSRKYFGSLQEAMKAADINLSVTYPVRKSELLLEKKCDNWIL